MVQTISKDNRAILNMGSSRKIKYRKLAMKFNGRLVTHPSSFFWGIEASQIYKFFGSYLRFPFRAHFVYAEEFRLRDLAGVIKRVLRIACLTEILSSIVQSAMVFMVREFAGFASQNSPMHRDHEFLFPISISPVCVEASSGGIPSRKPIPCIEPLKVLGIDKRILSLCKGNQAIGCIEGLDHFMSFEAAFH